MPLNKIKLSKMLTLTVQLINIQMINSCHRNIAIDNAPTIVDGATHTWSLTCDLIQ